MSFLFGSPNSASLQPITANPVHGGPLLQWMSQSPTGFNDGGGILSGIGQKGMPGNPNSVPHGTIDPNITALTSMFAPKGETPTPITPIVPNQPSNPIQALLMNIFQNVGGQR